MITNNIRENWKLDLNEKGEKLKEYQSSFDRKIQLYSLYLNTPNIFNTVVLNHKYINKAELKCKLDIFKGQIQKIDNSLVLLNNIFNSNSSIDRISNIGKKQIKKFKRKYYEIENLYLNLCIKEDNIIAEYISGVFEDVMVTIAKIKQIKNPEIIEKTNEVTEIENNDTLLISEKLGKVILPYTSKEVKELLDDENNIFSTPEEIIENYFTRPLSDFKLQFKSRYNETMKLARNREKYSLIDSVSLAMEMVGKRYLHPAIIASCRSLNELDVYLDCLDKNELDDFKIFKIKYELYPTIVKKGRDFFFDDFSEHKFKNKLKGLFGKLASVKDING